MSGSGDSPVRQSRSDWERVDGDLDNSGCRDRETEVGLEWAELQQRSVNDHMRETLQEDAKGSSTESRIVNMDNVDFRKYVNEHVLPSSDITGDNEKFLSKIVERLETAGVEIPTVEVRYKNLTIRGKIQLGTRALPTLLNTVLDFIDGILTSVNLYATAKRKLTILDSVSGILKPGRMTLLLGPPGSGKTTLLRNLAGLGDRTLEVEGNITYNGYELNQFEPKKTAAYVGQQDLHIPELTVRETMDFSARYQGVGSQSDLIQELFRKEKELGISPDSDIDLFMKASATADVSHKLLTEYYMKMMGLDVCADTIAGDQMRRGLSGGQKKRLTTGEMIVGPSRVFFMDNVSSGLDSSTAYRVVKCIGQFASISKKTVLMSLLQPAPETYGLFQEVILISGGVVVYHGPCENAEEFFESCGFKRPQRKGIADYLQEVTSQKDQEQYWADKDRPYHFVTTNQFAEAYKNFHVGQQMDQELKNPFDRSKSNKNSLAFNHWPLSSWELFKITFKKEQLYLKNNAFLQLFMVFQLAISSLIVASLFFRTKMHFDNLDDAQKLSGALWATKTYVAFISYTEITFTAMRLPNFIKFREMQFFPAWTWSLSMIILKIPTSTLQSLAYVGVDYYIIDMAPSAFRFLKQVLLLIIVVQVMSGLFRALAGMFRTVVLGSSIGGFVLSVVAILGGYIIPRTEIRGWWIWAYWATPLQYAQGALFVNEYFSHRWDKPIPNDNHTVGHRFIMASGFFAKGYWYWMSIGVLIGFGVLYNLVFTLAITFVPPLPSFQNVTLESLDELQQNHTGTGENQQLKSSTSQGSVPIKGEFNSGSSRAEGGTLGRAGSLSASHSGGLSTDIRSESPQRGMLLPFEPYAISFKDISYAVNMPKEYKARGVTEDRLQILRGITGAFLPGILTALVGVTGAGKSTLMDVLSGRKTRGYVEGEVRINGFPKVQETFSRIAGYCEQTDTHSSQTTVYEAVVFSAWLRLQPEVSSEEKLDFAMKVIDLVELTFLKDALVGTPGQTGLSTEQRKKLTIAVELVANPSIIFLDEPTTGLDARAAATVMRAVRNTVDTGRTVVCTIHQPSIDVFESFDELLFLKQGGQIIYSGPLGKDSQHLIEYFKSNARVSDIADGQNPAAWMLDITSADMEVKLGVDFAEIYRNSSAFRNTQNLVDSLSSPAPGSLDVTFRTRFAQPVWNQFTACLWKQSWIYWRSPGYNLMRLILSMSIGIFSGTMYWGIGKKLDTVQHIHALAGAVYMAQGFYGLLTLNAIQPLIVAERIVFYRERGAGMYSELPYALAQCLIEVPYIFMASTIFHLLQYSMMRMPWNAIKFFWTFFFVFITQTNFSFLGLVIVALSPSAEAAAVLTSFIFQMWTLFSNFIIPLPDATIWWKWLFWSNPLFYTVNGTMAVLTGKVNVPLTTALGEVMTVKYFVRRYYDIRYNYLKLITPLAGLYPFLFALGYMLFLKKLNFQQR